MNRYVLSESVENDLLEIFLHTIKKWDLEQAERYENQITQAFENIADDPFLIGSQTRDQYGKLFKLTLPSAIRHPSE